MKTIFKIFTILILISMYNACSPSHKTTNLGIKYEQSNLFEQASNQYYLSVTKNPKDIKAIAGLERTSNIVFNNMMNNLEKYFDDQNHTAAYDCYNKTKNYSNKMRNANINLNIPNEFQRKYDETKEHLANKHYINGKNHYKNNDWNSAISEFEKAMKYIPGYRDSDYLINESKRAEKNKKAEQAYQRGIGNMNNGSYRKAYENFCNCLTFVSGYKDANILKSDCLSKGKVRIAINEFSNNSNTSFSNINSLQTIVLDKLINFDSPFLDVVDRSNLNRLLSEHNLSMSGLINEETASKAGRLLGLNYIVNGSIISMGSVGGSINLVQSVNAYEISAYLDSEGKTKYKGTPVNFKIYEGSTNVNMSAQYQIINVETGKIETSDIISASESDYIKFADYSGNFNNLSIYDPKDMDPLAFLLIKNLLPDIDKRWFTARRNLKSAQELANPLIKDIGDKMAGSIANSCLQNNLSD